MKWIELRHGAFMVKTCGLCLEGYCRFWLRAGVLVIQFKEVFRDTDTW